MPQAAPAMQQQVTYLAPGRQTVVSQQVPGAPQTSAQFNCPQCGIAVDPATGQCPRCGLLLGKKLLEKMQGQAAPATPAATPLPFAPPSSAAPQPPPPSPPPPRPQSATGQQFRGGYITGPQYNYPPHSAPAGPGSGYPPSYGPPPATPYSGMQQQAPRAAPAAASVTTATARALSPARPYPYQVVRPAPRGWEIAPPTRRLLLRISSFGLLAVFVGFLGLYLYYAFSQPGATPPPITPDGTPPAIQNVSLSSITDTGAVVIWQTDEPATSQVMICDPDEVCTWTEPDETLASNHSVTLGDLDPNTTYHLTLISQDESENETIYERDFTTSAQADTTAPVISGVEVSGTTDIKATIEWSTDEEATSQVEYGITDAYGSTTTLDEELTTSHSVTLTDLEADTTYHFRVKSKDAGGNETTSDADQLKTLPTIPVGHQVGNRAPPFTLQNLDGDDVTLSDFRGKIVVVNFWFVACGPCAAEMPHIQAVSDNRSADELAILGVNQMDDADAIRSFMDTEELTFPALLDSVGAVHANYSVSQAPTTFFIDTEGIIRTVQVGPFSSQEEIESILDSL